MHKFLASVIVLFCCITIFGSTSAATLYTYTNAGNNGFWNVAGTWTTDPSGLSLTGSAVPANGDVVNILNGFTVNLNANVTATGLTININNGGALDLSTFTMPTVNTLSGSGTLRIKAGYFPTITTNNFTASSASGATVEYYDFTGTLPVSINYPNLTFTNTTSTNHVIAFSNATPYSLTIFGSFFTQASGTGSLRVNLGTQVTNVITTAINGNVTIGLNTTLGVGAFNAIHNVTVAGNFTNNGTVQFSNGGQYTASATGAANLFFTGATDNTLACNGITNLYVLTVNKGSSSTNILSVTSTSVSNLNFYSNAQLIFVTNGTLRLGSNITITQLYGAATTNYDVGSTSTSPMFWVDGATVNSGGSALVIYGKFRITAGSFTTVGGEGSVIREDGQYLIDGGTFTTEKFRPSSTNPYHRGSFIMTGGTFNATGTGSDASYARFSVPYEDQVFIMSGGTINVSNAVSGISGGIHIGSNAANYNVTGGTINAIISNNAVFGIASTAPIYNLNITKNASVTGSVRLTGIGALSGSVTTAQPLKIVNNFVIDGANSPVFDANTQSVSIGKDFTINSGATYTPNSNTTTFNGTTDQLFSNSGTITTGLYNLTINKPSGTVTLSGSATTFTVTQVLTLTSGVLNDGGKTLQVAGNIVNQAVHTGTGNITLNGSATQTLSGNGNGVFGNMILSNASVPGARATSDLAISGTLTLAGAGNSLFDIQQNVLALTSTSSTALATTGGGFSGTKMIRTLGLQSDGGIRKTYNDLSSFTFAFGVGSNYTPASLQLTSAPTTYGTVTMKPVNSRNSFIVAGNTNNLTYYWKVSSSGFTGLGATAVSSVFRYVESSVSPAADDVNYIPGRYNPTSWTVISDLTQVNDGTNDIFFTGVGYIDGEYTAGVPASFGTVKIFYSKRSGSWTNTGAGTTPWSNVSHSGPDATTAPVVGDHVYIGDGSTFNHVITIGTNGQVSGGLEISAGSTLDVGTTTGHNFGTFENTQITGSGTLRISSATAVAEFPAGDFGNFIRSAGGTVEYYSTGATDFTVPTTGSAPTNLPLISYRNLTITPGTGRYIAMPDQDMRIYGNLTVQGTSATGVARLNATTARNLTVNGNLVVTSGNLQFRNGTIQTIDLDGSITVGAGAIFDLAGTGTAVANVLNINGSVVNNGVFDMANGLFVCNTTFIGSSNVSITGTGATTDFNTLTVSKGTSLTPILEVNATAFTLSSATTPLALNNGTFRLTSAQTVTFANGKDFNIPSTARLSSNGGTLQLTGGDDFDLLLAGTLEVLAGTVNVGNLTNYNSIEYAATGQPILTASGGTLNVGGKIRRSASSVQGALQYTQSGTSIVSVGNSATVSSNTPTSMLTRGVFEILNSGSSFTMSGGTLRVLRALSGSTIAELYLQPSSNTVNGGTIEIGTGLTSQIIDINSTIPVFNLSVTGTTNTGRLETNPLVIRGSLTIGATGVFQANGLNVSIGGDFTNLNTTNNTVASTGGYQAGSLTQTTTIASSTGNQTITGVSGNLTNFSNLVINNTFSGGTVTFAPNSNLRVHNALTLSNGTIAGGDNTVTALSTVSNSTTQTNTAGGSITLAGSANQFVTGSGTGKFGNLILNNASGATFGSNHEITGTLTFTNGNLNIGSYGLSLSSTSLTAISGATNARYIITSGNLSDAGVTKSFAANVTAGNFIYPIGVVGKYTPANYTLTSGVLGGTITIRPVNSKHPSATGSGTAYINYYWSVTNSVIILSTLTHTYTYTAADESGTVANYRDARFKGGAWNIGVTAGNPNTTTRIITFTNTDVQGDYTAGEATAFVNPTTYTSIASGDWESDLSVWDIDPPGTNLGPPQGSFVIISEGHIVTMTDNAKRLATLQIRGRLHLGNTAGHDFGTVSTSGTGARTLQIQSTNFPSGDFSAFTAAGGGTVEYDGALTLPLQGTYNNLTFTGSGIKRLANADITVNGNVNVLAGTVTNAVSNRSIVLTSSTGDFTNNAVFLMGSGPVIIGRDLVNTGAGVSFTAGSGAQGLRVARNLINSSGATFTAATDSIGVRGTINNSSTFTANAGAIRVTGNFNNTAGTFTGGTGIISVTASLTNNATYTAGTGVTTVGGSFLNSGASAVYTANSNVLVVGGNVTHSSGSTFNAGTGSILISGNWNNTSSFNAGTGSVTFEKASAQTLTGATSFYNLTRSNGGSLTINDDVIVSNLLTLTSGNIITGANTVSVTNTALQPVTGYSNTSFIDGRLTISYPNASGTTRFYPVGKGAIYRPVAIQQTAASTSPVVRVEVVNTPPSGSYPASVGSLSPARYFAIDQLSGTMNSPTIELHFNTNAPQDEFISIPGNVRVLKSTAGTGPWTNEGGSGVFSPASPAGYVTSGVTSIGNPTVFTLSGDTPLPITLKYFDAVLSNGTVEVRWATVSEKNNAFFTIERSGPELQFDSISFIEGAGNSMSYLQYQLLDFDPLQDISYYRLKQTDYDGDYTYSDVVRINNSVNGGSKISLYPNPVEPAKPLYLKLDNQQNQHSFVVITDVTGRVYFSGELDLASRINVNDLNLKYRMDSGVYIITVASGNFRGRKKFIVY